MTGDAIAFGPFKVLRRERVLLEDGARVPLGSRAFDALVILIDRRGEYVSSDELASAVWPGQIVSDVSLRVNLSSLRKALRDNRTEPQYIKNIPSRGYMFVGSTADGIDPSAEQPRARRRPPAIRTVAALGRDDLIDAAAEALETRRLLTFAGAGGVGKTTVAVALANKIADRFADGVALVDLATVSCGASICNALAGALQVEVGDDPLEDLVRHLAGQNGLVVLDNCEHLVDDVAELVGRVIAGAPEMTIIATSREMLRLPAEFVVQVPPLVVPPDDETEGLSSYPSVALFLERASIGLERKGDADEEVRLAAEICRQLEGVPLGIELAAARVAEFGVAGVAGRLGDKLAFLTRGARNAARRHRTLGDAMEWSFSLLSDEERLVMARLSVFAGSFAMVSAVRISQPEAWSIGRTEDVIGGLVLKSLLNFEIVHGVEHYRLLFMTRDYARVELGSVTAAAAPLVRLAEDVLDLVQRAETDWNDGVNDRWRDLYARRIDDVRNALDWALSQEGDVALGIQIAARASVMFTVLGLTDEFRSRVEQALAACRREPGKYPVAEMRLLLSLGTIYAHTKGPLCDDDAMTAFRDSYDAAIKLDDHAFAMQALSAQSALLLAKGEHQRAVQMAVRGFDAIPGGSDHPVKTRTLSHSVHYLGDFDACQKYIDVTLAEARAGIGIRYTGAQYDQRNVTLRSLHAKMLWLRGFPDQGMKEALDCIEDASTSGHAISLCLSYGISGCLLAHSIGGREASEPLVNDFLRTAQRHALPFYRDWAGAYDAFMSDSPSKEANSLLTRIAALERGRVNAMLLENCAVLGNRLAEPWLVERVLTGEGGWCKGEATRAKAEIMLQNGGQRSEVKRLMANALEMARTQGALIFELRAASSLARLLGESDDRSKGVEILAETYSKFTEGFATVDLQMARELLSALA